MAGEIILISAVRVKETQPPWEQTPSPDKLGGTEKHGDARRFDSTQPVVSPRRPNRPQLSVQNGSRSHIAEARVLSFLTSRRALRIVGVTKVQWRAPIPRVLWLPERGFARCRADVLSELHLGQKYVSTKRKL